MRPHNRGGQNEETAVRYAAGGRVGCDRQSGASPAHVRAGLRGRHAHVPVAVFCEPEELPGRLPERRLCMPKPMHGELQRLRQALPCRLSSLRHRLRAEVTPRRLLRDRGDDGAARPS